MNILCATDFSQPSANVCALAKKLARRFDDALIITHVSSYGSAMPGADGVPPYFELCEMCEKDLARVANAEPRDICPVRTKLLFGDVALGLTRAASTYAARFLVVGTHREPLLPFVFGNTAEAVLKHTRTPVLLVSPHAASLNQWADSTRPLRALAAVDHTATTANMVNWLEQFRTEHPMDVTFVQCKGNNGGDMDLARYAAGLSGLGKVTVVAEEAGHDVGLALANAAATGGFDLLVTGTHHRHFLTRWLHTSVTQEVARACLTPVLCVPDVHHVNVSPHIEAGPKHVLAGTDFTDVGNRAVAVAYGLAGAGGTVDLCHVAGPEIPEMEVVDQLSRLVPDLPPGQEVETRVHALRGYSVAETLSAAADRLHADAICIAPRRRMLSWGSVTRSLVQQSHRPVYVVPELPH